MLLLTCDRFCFFRTVFRCPTAPGHCLTTTCREKSTTDWLICVCKHPSLHECLHARSEHSYIWIYIHTVYTIYMVPMRPEVDGRELKTSPPTHVELNHIHTYTCPIVTKGSLIFTYDIEADSIIINCVFVYWIWANTWGWKE